MPLRPYPAQRLNSESPAYISRMKQLQTLSFSYGRDVIAKIETLGIQIYYVKFHALFKKMQS